MTQYSENENQQHSIRVQVFALAYGVVTAQHKTINKTADRLELQAKWRADICRTLSLDSNVIK